MRIWMNEKYLLWQGTREGGALWWGRQAGIQFRIPGLRVYVGCPGGETELTAGYTEAVWDGGQGEFIRGS